MAEEVSPIGKPSVEDQRPEAAQARLAELMSATGQASGQVNSTPLDLASPEPVGVGPAGPPMLIPKEERARYVDFAVQLSRDLGSIAIPPDKILWHYTNGSALLAILESMSIYSTHISCLNDTTELRYGSKLFQEALANLRQTATDNAALRLPDGALSCFKENPDFPAQAVAIHFVACFSEKRDDLSQLRAYGNGENGYAIGFRAGDLWGCPNSALVRISYDESLHRQLARKAAEAMVDFAMDGLRKYAPPEPERWGAEFLEAWEKAITLVAPLIKDPAFSNENECRITKGFASNDLEGIRFVQKGSMMSRHLPLQPLGRTPTMPYRLPIAEIIVGPSRHPQTSRTSVDTLLRQKGYPTGLVSISKIPFQVT